MQSWAVSGGKIWIKDDDVLGLNMMQLPMPVSGADTLSEKRAQK
jgi:hypothetical protein